MSWRTVVVSSRCKLDYKLGYMVVRAEEIKKVFLDEIAVLIVENPAVALTGCLLEALNDKKIKVIFCDSKRNPYSELVPYYSCYDSNRKIRKQIEWTQEKKGDIWAEIVKEKIWKQAEFLVELGYERESELLFSYFNEVKAYDETNREGHAAKVYFNAIFGMDFSRGEPCNVNAALNYGYSILLSAFNREVCGGGYLTQIGLFHNNVFNHFNLSCDLMEPFRVLVDRVVYKFGKDFVFGTEHKLLLVDMLNSYVKIGYTNQTVLNAIKIYVRSVTDALNADENLTISFYSNEL